MVNVKIQITTQQMIQVVGSQKQTARYLIDGTRNRAKSINAHQRDDVLGGKPSDGAAHFKRNRRKRSPLSTGMSADFQSVSAPDADGISAVETDSRSGRRSAEHKRRDYVNCTELSIFLTGVFFKEI